MDDYRREAEKLLRRAFDVELRILVWGPDKTPRSARIARLA